MFDIDIDNHWISLSRQEAESIVTESALDPRIPTSEKTQSIYPWGQTFLKIQSFLLKIQSFLLKPDPKA